MCCLTCVPLLFFFHIVNLYLFLQILHPHAITRFIFPIYFNQSPYLLELLFPMFTRLIFIILVCTLLPVYPIELKSTSLVNFTPYIHDYTSQFCHFDLSAITCLLIKLIYKNETHIPLIFSTHIHSYLLKFEPPENKTCNRRQMVYNSWIALFSSVTIWMLTICEELIIWCRECL